MRKGNPSRFFLCVMLLFSMAYAQEKGLSANKEEKRFYSTHRINPHAPVIDGLMNDEAWNKVEWASGFTQTKPYEGQPPTEETSFKILYDDDNLYVFIRAHDSQPDKISRIMSRRDQFVGDMVEINIDSDFDQQTAFSFTAMASGVKGEEAITQNGNNWDSSWNPVWYLATTVDDGGWNAEMRIPFSQLRFGNKQEHVWGIQLMRHLHREEERSHFQFIPQDAPGMVHRFAELRGICNIKPARKIELLPYTVANTQHYKKEAGNPFADGSSHYFSMGLDGKVGLTNDITLDFTINPDFGQVEADPSQVNLTAFETYFSERRPFFIEGKSIYEFRPSSSYVIGKLGSTNLFYSRRIGRSPQNYPETEDDEFVDQPEASTILGAFKLSGKTKSGLSIGIMESVTSEERAEIDHLGDRRHESVEPMTNYFVARLQKDFDKGNTILGGMVTAVNRNIKNPSMNWMHTAAYTGGFDFKHYWHDKKWYVEFNGMFSTVQGDEEAIIRDQRASARYYQRPDGPLSVDSTLTSLSGVGGTLKFGKSGNGRISWQTAASFRSPGLELNDVGYMRYANILHHGTWVGYKIRKPFSIFHQMQINSNYWMYWDYSGVPLAQYANVNFWMEFKNRWSLNGSFTRSGESISMTRLRGGPSFLEPGSWSRNLGVNSDQRKKFYYNFGGWFDTSDEGDGENQGFWLGGTYRPVNAVRISLYPEVYFNKSDLQFVECVESDVGDRYLFSDIDQTTFDMTMRLNVCITPDLTVEFYGQPYVSAGQYNHFKRITRPRAANYEDRYHTFTQDEITWNADDEMYDIDENGDGAVDYSVEKPDFNVRQFRSNLVVRWEYSPGSTLYLVWSQSRSSSGNRGVFSYADDMRDLFRVYPHNVFLIKFNHWFSL